MRVRMPGAMPLARLEVPEGPTATMIAANCRHSMSATSRAADRAHRRLVARGGVLDPRPHLLRHPHAADRIAPLVPMALENRMGEAVDKQARVVFGGEACVSPAGQAAFQKMIDKLKVAGGIETPLVAQVVSSKVPNAFALPGGRGLPARRAAAEGKQRRRGRGRDGPRTRPREAPPRMRRIIQTGGTSFLVGLLFGDVTGGSAMIFLGKSIFDASYSRDSEREADASCVRRHAQARPLAQADGSSSCCA